MYIIFTIGLTCICSLLLDNFNDYEQTIVLYMTAITVITVFFYMYASTTIKIGYCYMIGFLLMALVCILGFYTLYFEKKTYNTLYFLMIFIVVYSFYIMCQFKRMAEGTREFIKKDDYILSSLLIYFNFAIAIRLLVRSCEN